MKRRNFITLLGGAAAWPLAARAQQTVRRVAVLVPSRETDARYQDRVRTLTQAMQQLGWSDGSNVRIDVRWAGDSSERLREIAADLASLAPDVIVASGSVATAAIKRATASIPVVFGRVNEPVTQGFVASLARPGGNITGFTNIDFTVVGKLVELLKTTAPALSRIGLMYNSDDYPIYDDYLHELQTDRRRPVEVVRAAVRQPAEIDFGDRIARRHAGQRLGHSPGRWIQHHSSRNDPGGGVPASPAVDRCPSAIRLGRGADVLWSGRYRYLPAHG
jgi:putative ABC transport system substrate-binding protein